MSWSDANAKISLVHTFLSRSSSAELNETKRRNQRRGRRFERTSAETNRDLGRGGIGRDLSQPGKGCLIMTIANAAPAAWFGAFEEPPHMPSDRSACLQRADNAKQRAAQATEPFMKSAYKKAAEHWTLLARRAATKKKRRRKLRRIGAR